MDLILDAFAWYEMCNLERISADNARVISCCSVRYARRQVWQKVVVRDEYPIYARTHHLAIRRLLFPEYFSPEGYLV